MFSTSGLPVAMSLMVSECNASGDHAEKNKLLRLTLAIFVSVGALGTALMAIFCRNLASFIAADYSYLCILAISPALFFVCISSTLRGYFQGHSNMLPTAISEILEAVGKMSLGILLGLYALNRGLPLYQVAAYSIIGVSVGLAAGTIFLMLSKLLGKQSRINESDGLSENGNAKETRSSKELLSRLFNIAIPVMISSSLLSMSSLLDTLIVIRRLINTGITESVAIAMYGNYTSYCVTLFNLPPALLYPIVNSLIPIVASARATGEHGRAHAVIKTALRLSAVIALPCAFGLATLSEPILKLIFTSEASAEMAAPLLSVLAPSVFLIGIMAVSNGILQSNGLQKYTLISMLCGAAVKALGAYLLPTFTVGGFTLRMYAAPISTFFFYLTVTVLNFYFIVKHTELRISVSGIYIRPFIASALCAVTAAGSFIILRDPIGAGPAVLIAIATAAAVYLMCLLLLGALTREDISTLPQGERICRLLEKMRLLRK
ncbi:MAG: polysaccharide biosynthesis protein [Clostridia bacterium]|nr:polysaccharide biosynthesis protein [Clostridia bacterium]